jgi:hypothetical protein
VLSNREEPVVAGIVLVAESVPFLVRSFEVVELVEIEIVAPWEHELDSVRLFVVVKICWLAVGVIFTLATLSLDIERV